ncbi:disintegrin and metalloproteinase domain-containing protein 10 [Amia ocellicauda]|uniref:disintegrin and metalloproteinase domain-containing protein 10 n=1 Tax=Amia ocellicauda TaxID=2972642 RepID=UPI0034641E4A
MNVIECLLLVLLFYSDIPRAGALKAISPFIRHYERLSYDLEVVHKNHERAKRATQEHQRVLQLDFRAYQRTFCLRLRRDTTAFSEDFRIHLQNGSQAADLSHIYSGELEDERGSICHGSVLQGQFEGFIQTRNGTYYVEPLGRYDQNHSEHHSVIYHEDDVDLSSVDRRQAGFCGSGSLQHFAQSLRQEAVARGDPVSRPRRTVDYTTTSCMLYLRTDYRYFKRFGSKEAVVAQVASYIKAVNELYQRVDFEGIRLINFQVKDLEIISQEDPSSPLYPTFIGPEKLLMLFSEANWDKYCLSYLLTDRDYSGTLGLAWEGMPGNSGGICSKYANFRGETEATLNTGLITLQMYGMYSPSWTLHLTLAHELGHSLGAPHDEGENCGDLGSSGGNGRYLMFPYASNNRQENNEKFSPCSIKLISRILRMKKDLCFVDTNYPVCGNKIVDKGEECDVGHNDNDPCCYGANQPREVQCRLKPHKRCSPSQGLCCASHCEFKPPGMPCKEESECQQQSLCRGSTAACPPAPHKPNMTECSKGKRVCVNGECMHSLCAKYGLEQCDCPGISLTEKCFLCCQEQGIPQTCASTTSSILSQFFSGTRVALLPGTPCSDKKGYCDKFNVCRLLDADGPIARLKNSFLHLDKFEDLADWMIAYWWVILLAILTLSALMASTVFLFGRHES